MAQHHGNGQAPNLLRAALAFGGSGKQIFPCEPRGKKPACAHGLNDATGAPAAIERWWRENPAYNIGLVTGPKSGLWVTDTDVHKYTGETIGADSLAELEAQHGPLPRTIQAFTPRGGSHFYWRWPRGLDVRIRNSAGKLGAGIDIRGAGGYVLAPPSVGQTGTYTWSVDNEAVADAPGWLLEMAAEPRAGKAKARFVAPPTDWCTQLANGISEPGRNDFCTRLTGLLLRHHLDPYVVRELVLAFGLARCRPPLDPDEVDTIVASVCRTELRRRQGNAR